MSASAHPRLALLIGDPVVHSLSPLIHGAAFRAARIDAVYLAARVPSRALDAAIQGLRAPAVLGANITIPHKEAATLLVDELDERASRIGAINTIVSSDAGRLTGCNTDVVGFLAPLDLSALTGARALVLGGGGAARAVIYALLVHAAPSAIIVAARNLRRAEGLVREFETLAGRNVMEARPAVDGAPAAESVDLVVNATPVGMEPDPDATPLPGASFRAGQIVYDLVYAPRHTRLLREAARSGATTISGINMLVGQAAESFRLWTGVEMPLDPVWDTVRVP